MDCGQDNGELNYALQESGVCVLNLSTRQLERHPAYTESGKLFITDRQGRTQGQICEVNIEGSMASKMLGRQAVYVRKSDLQKDPVLYRWFSSLGDRSADSRWGPVDSYTTRQLKEAGLL